MGKESVEGTTPIVSADFENHATGDDDPAADFDVARETEGRTDWAPHATSGGPTGSNVLEVSYNGAERSEPVMTNLSECCGGSNGPHGATIAAGGMFDPSGRTDEAWFDDLTIAAGDPPTSLERGTGLQDPTLDDTRSDPLVGEAGAPARPEEEEETVADTSETRGTVSRMGDDDVVVDGSAASSLGMSVLLLILALQDVPDGVQKDELGNALNDIASRLFAAAGDDQMTGQELTEVLDALHEALGLPSAELLNGPAGQAALEALSATLARVAEDLAATV